MAPNKFEKHIKKELQSREIQPSAKAWETLSEKLDEATPHVKRRNYFWYGIAASCIGLLIISVLYFNQRDAIENSNNQMVETKKEVIDIETSTVSNDDKESEVDVVRNNHIQQEPALEDEKVFDIKSPELVIEEATLVESPINQTEKLSGFKEEIINNKILEIVSTVDSLEQNNEALTETEVENLLRNAQQEIIRDKLFGQQGSVDAMALLTEVEDELDKSFRDQIFESLKSGFLKVRTAVADRNK